MPRQPPRGSDKGRAPRRPSTKRRPPAGKPRRERDKRGGAAFAEPTIDKQRAEISPLPLPAESNRRRPARTGPGRRLPAARLTERVALDVHEHRRPWAAPGLGQVCGCCALCSFGSMVGLIGVLHELSHHVRGPVHAFGYAGVTLWLSVVLGWWLPRRLAQRRLASRAPAGMDGVGRYDSGWNDGASQAGVELEFAASLAGGLILGLGAAWLALCGVAAGMETYRAFVVQRFLLPAWLTRGVILAPVLGGLLLTGAIGTAAFTAHRGWLRLLSTPPANHQPLWVALLVGAAAGAGFATLLSIWGGVVVATLVPIFAAGILAVYRRLPGAPVAEPGRPTPAASFVLGPTVVAVMATLSVGLSCVMVFDTESLSVAALGRTMSVLAGSVLAGWLVWRSCERVADGASLVPLFLLLSAVAWGFAHRWAPSATAAGLLRVASVGCCGTVCALLVLPRLISSQRGVVAAGVALALAAVVVMPGWVGAGALVVIATLGTTAAAGLLLVFDPPVRAGLRTGGLCAVGAWLGILLASGNFELTSLGSRQAGKTLGNNGTAARAAQALYTGPGVRPVYAAMRPTAEASAGPSAWDIDLTGPRNAIVVARAGDNPQPAVDRRAAARLIRRCAASLVRGGHLVVELPGRELALATIDFVCREGRTPNGRSYWLRVTADEDAYAALLVGPDVPAWIDQHSWPGDVQAALDEVGSRPELEERLAALPVKP